MKSILAKFKVGSVTNFGNNNIEVKMTPVVSGSEENKSFSIYTPSGDCRLHITNPDVTDYFEAGKEYYLEFSRERKEHVPDWIYANALEIIDDAYSFLSAKGMANPDAVRATLLTTIRNFRNYEQKP